MEVIKKNKIKIKKSTNKNTKKLRGKPSSIERKTIGQIQPL